MPRLNETDRCRAIGMIEAGVRHTDVARQFGFHRNNVDATNSLGQPETGTDQDIHE